MKHKATGLVLDVFSVQRVVQQGFPTEQPPTQVEVSATFVDDDDNAHGGLSRTFDSRELPLALREQLMATVRLIEEHLTHLHFDGVPTHAETQGAATGEIRGIAEQFSTPNDAEPFDRGG